MTSVGQRITLDVSGDTLVFVKSLRLDPVLEKRLQRAAAVQGESLSEFMRRAAADRADRVLGRARRGSASPPDWGGVHRDRQGSDFEGVTLTDASPLVALIDADEADHRVCTLVLDGLRLPLVTT